MLDKIWNLEQYSWETNISDSEPIKAYCLPPDPNAPIDC